MDIKIIIAIIESMVILFVSFFTLIRIIRILIQFHNEEDLVKIYDEMIDNLVNLKLQKSKILTKM